jgi:hypothetical protein
MKKNGRDKEKYYGGQTTKQAKKRYRRRERSSFERFGTGHGTGRFGLTFLGRFRRR